MERAIKVCLVFVLMLKNVHSHLLRHFIDSLSFGKETEK
jgi:hypothetical protein